MVRVMPSSGRSASFSTTQLTATLSNAPIAAKTNASSSGVPAVS